MKMTVITHIYLAPTHLCCAFTYKRLGTLSVFILNIYPQTLAYGWLLIMFKGINIWFLSFETALHQEYGLCFANEETKALSVALSVATWRRNALVGGRLCLGKSSPPFSLLEWLGDFGLRILLCNMRSWAKRVSVRVSSSLTATQTTQYLAMLGFELEAVCLLR